MTSNEQTVLRALSDAFDFIERTLEHGSLDADSRVDLTEARKRIANANSVANVRLMTAAPELLAALEGLAKIARYYHKGEAEGHLDACENPDCCGHCLVMRDVNAAIAQAKA